METYYENLNLSSDAVWGWIERDTDFVRWVLISIIAAVLLGRLVRSYFASRSSEVQIEYVDGPKIRHSTGPSLLDISKLKNVSHASVCGGRGRCSTCRVRVLDGLHTLELASDSERKALERVRAEADVRLACQIFPQSNLKVIRLLPSDATMVSAASVDPFSSGTERTVAVMFADLRDFTRTAEKRLPFDVVYLINQFSQAMGQSVQKNNGRIDKFLGDGFMALFGLDSAPEQAARTAIAAAAEMMEALQTLNDRLEADLDEPLRMGIGVHIGSVIVGEMGFGSARGLTAIGDTVNIASRLEAATKTEKCTFCLSAETANTANLQLDDELLKEITVRGKREKLAVYTLNQHHVATTLVSDPTKPEKVQLG